jgi:hypothetical protein
MALSFEHARRSLGFSLELIDSGHRSDEANMADAVPSKVRLKDASRGVTDERTISADQPLAYKNYTFHQLRFDRSAPGGGITLFVAYDPGKSWTFAGGLMLCLGLAIMSFTRLVAA